MKTLIGLIVSLIVIAVGLVVIVWGKFGPWWGLVAVTLVLVTAGAWFYRSLTNFVDANEMGIRVLFGKADKEVYVEGDSLFVPWLPKGFKCYLKLYPMSMFDLDYDIIKVMTKEGDYPVGLGTKHYGAVEVSVESMAYLNFPREREMLVNKETEEPVCFLKDLISEELNRLEAQRETTSPRYPGVTLILEKTHPLVKILRAEVPVPRVSANLSTEERTEEKGKLQDWSEEAMTSAVRAAAARITWKQANEDPLAFKDKVEESYLTVDGVLIRAGFRPSGIKLAIKHVDPPEQLKSDLAGEESASHVANRESTEVGEALVVMVDRQIAAMRKNLPDDEKMTKEDCLRVRQECLNQLTRDRTMKGGGKLVDTRVASADGTPFAQGSLSEIIGGIVATVAASWASKEGGVGKPDTDKKKTDRDELRHKAAEAYKKKIGR